MRVLYWLRNDLRLRDNQCWKWIRNHLQSTDELLVLATPQTSAKPEGNFANKFREQCLLGLALEVRPFPVRSTAGDLKTTFTQLQQKWQFDLILYSSESCTWERRDEAFINCIFPKSLDFDQTTLIQELELPFTIEQLPRVFTEFRQKVETRVLTSDWYKSSVDQIWGPRPGEDALHFLPRAKALDLGRDPLFPVVEAREVSNFSQPIIELNPGFQFVGGPLMAHQRLRHYLWESNAVQTYFETRNGLEKIDDSTKLSPWLATGSISAREIVSELRRYEGERVKNKSTYWVLFELLWRDFFKFEAKKSDARLFQIRGVLDQQPEYEFGAQSEAAFQDWCDGKTNYPFINACMNELRTTGWMSNRGRQNAASYLAKEARVPWTWGANWFEQYLVDFDPSQNWGNWCYFAGVGRDPRNRSFNIETQTKTYDPLGTYQALWKK
jgi:deoxyribodipyrimidine photo-lyase